jgi:hypothetical protein
MSTSADAADRPPASLRGSLARFPPRSRRVRALIATLAVLLAVGCAGALYARAWVHDLESAALAGKASGLAGVDRLRAEDAAGALDAFAAAGASFARVREMLARPWMASTVGAVPWSRRNYDAAVELAAIGSDAAAAGSEIAGVMRDASSTPSPAKTSRLGKILSVGRVRIDHALAVLLDAARRASSLSTTGLDPHLAGPIGSLKSQMSSVVPYLSRATPLLVLEHHLLTGSHKLLVVAQNSAEIRPTGGFVGSYGLLDVGETGLSLDQYRDVYTLKVPKRQPPAPPGMLVNPTLTFRDANWWMDYPTSARAMLGFWTGYGEPQVDGIVAIDVIAVRNLLRVTGPITLPSYKTTFTADNLLEELLYLIEVKARGGEGKKDVLVALAAELQSRVLASGVSDLIRVASSLAASADQKHVQIYFTDPAVQAAVADTGWSGSVAPPSGTTDVLGVCNAMTAGGKVNIAMRKSIDYSVELGADGSAETTLVLDYANRAPLGFAFSRTIFRDYLRVFRAPGSILPAERGPVSQGVTTTVESGLPTVARAFTLVRGQTRRETFFARVPGALRQGPTGSSGGTGSARYRLFLIRQADLQDIPTTVTVSAPPGWRIAGARAWKRASSYALRTDYDTGAARLAIALDSDVIFDVEMVRR